MSARAVRTLIIRPDHTWEVSQVVPELEHFYRLLDTDQMERVTCRAAAFYLDENGKAKHKALNAPATLLARYVGLGIADDDFMVGTVLVVGSEIRGEYETGVTDQVLYAWQSIADALAARDSGRPAPETGDEEDEWEPPPGMEPM